MVRFTLFEVNLDGAEFNASAPFSGKDAREAKDDVETTLKERLERESGSADSGTSPVALLLGFVVLAGAVSVARKLRSRRRSGAETESTGPIVAD